jgi:DNA-binding beta-propeller fold protein YncE
MKCSFCGNAVIIPQDLRTPPRMDGFDTPRKSISLADLGDDPQAMQAIHEMIRSGNKLEAIKRFRELTGLGLKESKDAIDAIEQAQGTRGNASAVKVNTNAVGCIVAVIVITIILSAVVPILVAIPAIGAAIGIASQSEDQISAVATTIAQEIPIALPTTTPSFANIVLSFGEKGSGAGMLDDSRHVGVDRGGNMYVGNYGDGRVQVFDPQGKYLRMINLGEVYLVGMAVAPDGTTYLSYGGNVHVHDASGAEIKVIDHEHYLEDITLGADGSLYAATSREEILRFDQNGNITLTITDAFKSITKDSELDIHLAVDGLGNIYALGSFNTLVLKYAADGTFIDRFGGESDKPGLEADPGKFQSVNAIGVDQYGRVYVSDIFNIQVFGSDGQYIDSFKLPEGVAFGFAFDLENNMYAATHLPKIYKLTVDKP